jgi:hypothetical protein
MTLLCACAQAGSRDDGKRKLKDIRPIMLHGFSGDEVTDLVGGKWQVTCVRGDCGAMGR